MILIQALLLAQAAQAVPAYACDVQDGHYEKYDLRGGGQYTEIAGIITPLARDSNARWASAAGVLFEDDKGKNRAGLQLWSMNNWKRFEYGIRVPGANADTPRPLGALPTNTPVTFGIRLDRTGLLTLRVNDQVVSARNFKTPPLRAILMCSGGSFRFDQLSIASAD